MSDLKVANRYARALFELAKERNELNTVYQDFITIKITSRESRELQQMFLSPVVKADKKMAVINLVFKSLISSTTLTFLELLTQKGRDAYIPLIAQAFTDLYLENKNIVVAYVTSAIPLDDDLRNKVKAVVKRQTGKDVQLEEKVDKDIIGGYILRVGDNQDDSSIEGRLKRIEREFKENRMETSAI